MTATRISRRASARRASRARKAVARRVSKTGSKPTGKLVSKFAPAPQVQFRLCKPGWAVLVDKIPNAQGTRFVCPFCPLSHRVPGPVRGFRKLRRAQWVKLRRVEE
ncbi:MAG TPA: hypothetical protein VEI55_02980 [Candidatus Acidoferrum sp.]|nr:hypothetical protein [Candidatus Acidoferrum sp.]